MTPAERWLAHAVATRSRPAPCAACARGRHRLWPTRRLRADPARPRLRRRRHRPAGTRGTALLRIEFERAELPPHDAVVASTSLHHVADPAAVIDRITSTLASGGAVVVVEWAWERFDEQTAAWCFERLGPDNEAGWLHRRRDEWLASGREWPSLWVPRTPFGLSPRARSWP